MKLLSVLLSAVGVSGWIFLCPVQAQEQNNSGIEELESKEMWLSGRGTATDLILEDTATHMAQREGRVTAVEIIETAEGLELVLKAIAGSERLVPLILTEGEDLIIDIPDATLAFALRNGVTELNPAPGISSITVNQEDENSIRVRIKGTNQTPSAEVIAGRADLALSIVPASSATAEDADEEIGVIATRSIDDDDSYQLDEATVGTRTDTPLQDIPQSIQIIPQSVIEDQRITRVEEALENVAGVASGTDSPRDLFTVFAIRGFDTSDNTLTNGLQDSTNGLVQVLNNVERIEVLKGPASVLFGQGTVGGTVNYVTKQPLAEPFFNLKASIGNFDLYGGGIDVSGPVNEDQTVLYRLSGFAQTNESFVDFFDRQEYQIAPVLTWKISDRTKITFEGEYAQINTPFDAGLPAQGTVEPNPNGEIPRETSIAEPDIDNSQNTVYRIGYNFEHSFNDNWQLKSIFRASLLDLDREILFSFGFADDLRTIIRSLDQQEFNSDVFNIDNYVVGEFKTGSIKHKLVAGFNLFRQTTEIIETGVGFSSIDIFDPVFGVGEASDIVFFEFDIDTRIQSLGLFVQDQINFTDNLIVVLGGRFDISSQDFENAVNDADDFDQEEAFNPRVGIVYQPIEPISLYANFTRSFQQAPNVFSGALVEPERGTQFEIGVKGNISDRLSATLAFYDLTLTNVATTDPDNPLLTIPTGEQSSRGIELDVSGEILPGWNVIVGYAYTDARVTEDNNFEVGNRLANIPENEFNISTIYKIQQGSLVGLGFGLGIFVVGDRPGDLDNSFELPGYTRVDASIAYEEEGLRAAVNFKNLFDNEFFASAQSANLVFPADPFTVVGSLSYKF
ncbi:MAG: TonB-dependent siderophore receptor [Cyanobacteria bacterium P01_C01_bin.72]